MSSNNLDKYKYLAGEDLDLKCSTFEQARFKYSLLVKIFNKGLKEEDKKEWLLKRLKNIAENIKEVTDFAEESLILDAKGLIEEMKTIQKDVDYRKLKVTGGNKIMYDLSD